MAHYHTLGSIPHKRHTQFRKPDGELYSEQLFSTEGFSNDYSILYHCHPPTELNNRCWTLRLKIIARNTIPHRAYETGYAVYGECCLKYDSVPWLMDNLLMDYCGTSRLNGNNSCNSKFINWRKVLKMPAGKYISICVYQCNR